MKKFTLLMMVALLASSCTCLLSQIPPQYIYVGESCSAPLPDYVPQVTVSDNCELASVVQTPAPGFVLDANTQTVTVKIRATDVFNNYSEIEFTVTAVDTIPPTIIPSGDLMTDNWLKINNIYDIADRLVAEQEQYFDEHFDWDAAGIPEDKRPIDQYNKKILSILVSPAHATTGYGGRVFTYLSNADSYIVK
jgi:hypothetical protein